MTLCMSNSTGDTEVGASLGILKYLLTNYGPSGLGKEKDPVPCSDTLMVPISLQSTPSYAVRERWWDHRLFLFYNLCNLSSAHPTIIPPQEHWMPRGTWPWNLYMKAQECLVLWRRTGRGKSTPDAEPDRPEFKSPPCLSPSHWLQITYTLPASLSTSAK